jgi:hypothetical protein
MNNKIRKSGNYTALSNEIINDKRLNLRSLGLFLYMWAKPDNWNFTLTNIAKARNVGREQILTALKELKKAGYVKYEKLRDGTGIYYLSDTIDIPEPKSENPTLANYSQPPQPKVGKPKVGFPDSYINTIRNKEEIYFHGIQDLDLEKLEKEIKTEKWKKWNEQQVKKQLKIDKLENLAQANRKNEVFTENQDPKTTG